MEHTVLTIEDDQIIRETLVEWLEDNGFTPLMASSGAEGLATFAREHPDMVLLDLTMPGMNGLSVLRAIREQDPDVPVIIVSGRNNIADVISAFKAGAWDYVTKPILSMDMLKATILNCLEKKELKEQIKQVEERYSQLVQNLPIIIFALRKDFSIDFINRTSQAILGFSAHELMEKRGLFFQRIPKEDRKEIIRSFTTCFRQSTTPFSLEFRFKHKQGYFIHLQAKSIVLVNPDNPQTPRRIEGVLLDVTEHHFLEEVLVQREKLNLLGTMSTEIAHQFRNPLMSLGGFARILHNKYPDIKEAEIVLSEAKKLEELLANVDEYIRPVSFSPTSCQINDLLMSSIGMLKELFIRHQVDHSMDLTPNIPPIMSDENTIRQILISLISQIVPQARHGRIRFASHATSQHVGITVSIAPSIKELKHPGLSVLPFEKEQDNSMAATYRMVKNIGGYISFKQSTDRTSVTITLPKTFSQELVGMSEQF
ncbi:response regulator [Desulfoplanes formicivorans]|uniref:histidine kinase n=1 Tax=Desulfoplanes formicivorans TaxID=1592317 RepID=A0A194AH55_9BACT|nr:response regulator [Desulfoplanes formicivorans]GAU08094.1 histidine kinase [Desulfoplanes formicivorans]